MSPMRRASLLFAPLLLIAGSSHAQRVQDGGGDLRNRVATFAQQWLRWAPDATWSVGNVTGGPADLPVFRAQRKSSNETLNDSLGVVLDPGRDEAMAGEVMVLPESGQKAPATAEAAAARAKTKLEAYFRTTVTLTRDRKGDRPGLAGWRIEIATPMGPHRIPGWISSDRKLLVLGKWLPLSGDPRAWRREVLSKLPGARSGSGRLVIHDFADLQCAFCKRRTAAVEEYLRSHPALGATLEFHFFPLYQGHPWSVVSASAGKCLSSSIGADTFFLYAHGVFERQEALDADSVRSFAGDVAASAGSREKWDRCMAAKEGEKKALRDLEAGFELGVRATPTFFVDGTMVSGDDGVLERFLEQMAAAAGPVRKGP